MENLFCNKKGVLELNHTYSNSDLWVMAERGMLEPETIVQDSSGNQLVFTGKSFQVFDTKEDEEKVFVGMTVDDEWQIVGVYDEVRDIIKQ